MNLFGPKLIIYGIKYFWMTIERSIYPKVHCVPCYSHLPYYLTKYQIRKNKTLKLKWAYKQGCSYDILQFKYNTYTDFNCHHKLSMPPIKTSEFRVLHKLSSMFGYVSYITFLSKVINKGAKHFIWLCYSSPNPMYFYVYD